MNGEAARVNNEFDLYVKLDAKLAKLIFEETVRDAIIIPWI